MSHPAQVRPLKRMALLMAVFSTMVGHRGLAATTEQPSAIPQEREGTSPEDAIPEEHAPSTANIERMIQQLNSPLGTEKVSDITFAIQELDDEEEQARLEQLLNERLTQLGGAPVPSRASTTPVPEPESSDTDNLQTRIDMLNLGPSATVEELRARDQVVSDIAGLTDPVERERLLQHLQQHEQDAASE